MSQNLVEFHVVEPGVTSRPTQFEVTMIVEPDQQAALAHSDGEAWVQVIRRAKQLIGEHLDSERESSPNL
jgi:hypothetical protein